MYFLVSFDNEVESLFFFRNLSLNLNIKCSSPNEFDTWILKYFLLDIYIFLYIFLPLIAHLCDGYGIGNLSVCVTFLILNYKHSDRIKYYEEVNETINCINFDYSNANSCLRRR